MRSVFLTIVFFGCLCTTSGVSLAQEFEFIAVSNTNEYDEDYEGLLALKNYVETNSGGRIEIHIYTGNSFCSSGDECLEGIASGSIDIFVSIYGASANKFPFVQVFDVPYLLSNDRVVESVIASDLLSVMRQKGLEVSDGTTRLMAIGNTGGWRNFGNTQRRIEGPDDLFGLAIRTTSSSLSQEFIHSMGATPLSIPWPDLFLSFQNNVIEGTMNSVVDVTAMGFYDVGLRYITLDRHSYMASLAWMNNDSFIALPQDLRLTMIDGFIEFRQATVASYKRRFIDASRIFRENGGEIYVLTPAQRREFADTAMPLQDWFRKNYPDGAEVLDAMISGTIEAERLIGLYNIRDQN